MKNEMKNEINGMENRMNENMSKNMGRMARTMRGEMQCMGAGLQKGVEQLKIGSGELLRATCWASRERRRLEVTEEVTVTRTLKGEETTSTRETRRQVTELTETREVGERL